LKRIQPLIYLHRAIQTVNQTRTDYEKPKEQKMDPG